MTIASTASCAFEALLATLVLRRISIFAPLGRSTPRAAEARQNNIRALFIAFLATSYRCCPSPAVLPLFLPLSQGVLYNHVWKIFAPAARAFVRADRGRIGSNQGRRDQFTARGARVGGDQEGVAGSGGQVQAAPGGHRETAAGFAGDPTELAEQPGQADAAS